MPLLASIWTNMSAKNDPDHPNLRVSLPTGLLHSGSGPAWSVFEATDGVLEKVVKEGCLLSILFRQFPRNRFRAFVDSRLPEFSDRSGFFLTGRWSCTRIENAAFVSRHGESCSKRRSVHFASAVRDISKSRFCSVTIRFFRSWEVAVER